MAKKKSQSPTFRNRIIANSLGVKAADQFLVHPLNAKYHPEFQRKVLAGALEEVGFVAPVIESKRTGYLLDGHERVWISLINNDQVPFVLVDIDETEEAYVIATLDPIGWLSSHNVEKLEELLGAVKSADAFVQQLLAGVSDHGGADAELLNTIKNGGNLPDERQEPTERGEVLSLIDVTIADPKSQCEMGRVYELGRHVLIVADVIRDWSQWSRYLVGEDTLFCPHAGVYVILSEAAKTNRLVMVQPSTWIAGHIIDRYNEVSHD